MEPSSPKRICNDGAAASTSKHAIGYSCDWEEKYPWLESSRDETGTITGMMCSWCKRHKTKNKYNHKAVWSVTPCKSLRKDCVSRHNLSQQHKEAVELESFREASLKSGGIEQAFQSQISLNRSAIKTAMQCLYWLIKSEIPHTSNYNSLVKAVEFMGCEHLRHLNHGENAKYSSQRIIQEFLDVMGEQLRQDELQHLFSSPCYSIMIDETTDIAIINEMVIYVRYLSPEAEICTSFLAILELNNGTAETVEKALLTYLEDSSIPLSSLVGFGSDGASVMTGRLNGVGARLKRLQPILTSVHCVAHRLALAAGQSGDVVPFIKNTFKPTLRQLFYFYENSSVRMSGLKSIEALLETPELKLKQPADTRWLSHDAACLTLVKVLPAVITSLEREAAERGQALAVGLSRVVKQYKFLFTLYMMCDILPIVSHLSRVFQASTLDLSTLDKMVSSTIESLQLLCDQPGVFIRKLDSDLTSLLLPFAIHHTPEMKQQCQQHILKKFVMQLIENIKDRFPDTGIHAVFDVLNPSNLPQTPEEAMDSKYGESQVEELQKHYGNENSPFIDSDKLMAEWSDLRTYMILHYLSKPMKEVLQMLSKTGSALSTIYPNFSKLAQVCLCIPLSTADCERAFSTMKRIKTRLRSQLKNKTLNNCMRISMEGSSLEYFDFDKSLHTWSHLKNRRIV